jgi:hypothetical protein
MRALPADFVEKRGSIALGKTAFPNVTGAACGVGEYAGGWADAVAGAAVASDPH